MAFDTTEHAEWDPLSPEAVDDPVLIQSRLRASCPIAWTERSGGFWSIFRYGDIARVTRDPATFAQGRPQRGNPRPPLEVNPPIHTAYRSVLHRYFTATAVGELESDVRAMVVERLNPLIESGGGDFARSFTYPLPTQVVCRFLRLPPSSTVLINRLSDEIYLNEEGRGENPAAVAAAEAELTDFAFAVVAERRRLPEDPSRDLISGMIAAEIEGATLSDHQIVEVLRLLFVAGHNSTTSSLGICFLAMARDGALQDRLRAQPELIGRAIDEFLRLETPVMGMPRTVTKPTEIGSASLNPGDQLFLVWASANRDASVFPEADVCKIDRAPNKHMTFGRGIHACIGRDLAELELRVACEELLARSSHFELAAPSRRSSWVRFGVSSLHLRVKPAS
ncbi:MAG: cytochrome P450 [Acidimicrobiales bacterium]